MRKLIIGLAMSMLSAGAVATAFAAEPVSMAVPGSTDATGGKVLPFIAKDPPGVRCNGNLQAIAEVANTYRVPIQLLPSSLAPGLLAPSVFYGNQMLVADCKDHNGPSSFQSVAEVLEMEDAPKQPKTGLLYQEKLTRTSTL